MTEEHLFDLALGLGRAERAALLDRECAGNPEFRARVEALLAADAKPHFTIDEPVRGTGEYSPSGGEPGAVIAGRYTLVESIGEGGMGEVWVAKQSEPVKRKVALKLIKAGMDTKAVVQRFEAERQALALMDHPNIAKVLDGGMTAERRPFFVMELVNGLPLTRFCDEAKLGIRGRLELFVAICQAVQHAHQKGIIHRDLKPSNILVTVLDGKPIPKIIDFGVAKAVGGRLTEESISTQFGAVVGTLEYMSPEQAGFSAADVDTRSDIYSLGVILYELLTGLKPIDAKRLRQAALNEMIRIIREEEPSRPSTRLSADASAPSLAALRLTEPKKLAALLRGELDWVVMKCLEKQRDRRYETANGLARDVQRYLADEPVEARPPTAAYRLRKFVRRNRGSVLAAGLVLLVLVAGIAGTTWGLVQARAAAAAEAELRRQARAALDDMLSDDSLAFLKTQTDILPPQRAFLERAVKHYQEFAAQTATTEEGRELVARAQVQLGYIYEGLGKVAEAETAFRLSSDGYDRLALDFPTVPRYRQGLGRSQFSLGGALYVQGKLSEGETAIRTALATLEKLVADVPDAIEYRFRLAQCYGNLGRVLQRLGRLSEAEAMCRAGLAAEKRLVADFPGKPEYHASLADSHNTLGDLLTHQGKNVLAEVEWQAALAAQKKLVADFPNSPEYRHQLAMLLNNLASLRVPADAATEYWAGLTVQEKLVHDYPAVAEYRRMLAQGHSNLGGVLVALGERAEAEAQMRSAVRVCAQLVDLNPKVPDDRMYYSECRINLANLLLECGKNGDAADEFRTALSANKMLAADYPGIPSYRSQVATGHSALGRVLFKLGNLNDAVTEYRAALELRDKLILDYPSIPGYREAQAGTLDNLAMVYDGLNRRVEGDAARSAALRLQQKLADDFPNVSDYRSELAVRHLNLGATLTDIGQWDKALVACRTALALMKKLTADSPGIVKYRRILATCYINIGTALHFQGKLDDAGVAYRAALSNWEKLGAEVSAVQDYVIGRCNILNNLGELAFDRGQMAAALNWFAGTVAALEPVNRADPRVVGVRRDLHVAHKFRAMALARLGRHTAAVADWDLALAMDDSADHTPLYLGRAEALARAGDAAKALAAADALAPEKLPEGGRLYKLAMVYALAAKNLPTIDAARAAGRADALWRQAVATGFPELAAMLKGDDLDALRRRTEYADLLWDLADGTKP